MTDTTLFIEQASVFLATATTAGIMLLVYTFLILLMSFHFVSKFLIENEDKTEKNPSI